MVQYFTGLTTKLLTLGTRDLLRKPANVLTLAETFCLLSREASSGQFRASGDRAIGQASFKSIQPNWLPNWDLDSYEEEMLGYLEANQGILV